AKVRDLVADAVDRGARVRLGGEPVEGPGSFYPATVLTDVPREARLSSTEVFGPVAAITEFDSEEEAVALANDTPYGLVAYVYTENLARGIRWCEAMETVMAWHTQRIAPIPAALIRGLQCQRLALRGEHAWHVP